MKILKAVFTNSLYTVIIGVLPILSKLKVFSFSSHNTVINSGYNFIKVQNEFIQ